MSDRCLVYLAVPYSHAQWHIRAARFEAANAAAALLMGAGEVVFSPISHTHPIAVAGDLPKGWDYWEVFDRVYLGMAKRVDVLCIDGWRESRGVRAELAIAAEMGIPARLLLLNGNCLHVVAELRPEDLEGLADGR